MSNIETLTFDNISLGHTKIFSIKITEEILKKFAAISGDFNPLHMDEKYAKNTQFNKRICHGMLLASFFSRLIGMYIPGKQALYFSQSLNFISPCFIGDTVKVTGTVTKKTSATKMLTIKTEIHNQNNDCIVNGVAKVIVRE
jgi:3-hydroxybutyryl-CoA dehydratase